MDLYTDATVTDLTVAPSGDGIQGCLAHTRGGKTINFRAKALIPATGGIENARLLLDSNIGNEHDQVGRCFMNHPKNPSGLVVPVRPVTHLPAYFGCLYKGRAAYLALRLTDELQEQLETLNSYVRFEPLYAWSDTAGVQLLINYVKSKRWLWENLKSFKGEASALRDYAETGDDPDIKLAGEIPSLPGLLLAMLKDSPSVAQYANRPENLGGRLRLPSARSSQPVHSRQLPVSDEWLRQPDVYDRGVSHSPGRARSANNGMLKPHCRE